MYGRFPPGGKLSEIGSAPHVAMGKTAAPPSTGRTRRRPTARARVGRRFAALVELAPDAMVVADDAGRIQLVNSQTEVVFGYPREELLGQPVEMLLPERFRAAHVGHRADYAAAPHTRPMGVGLRLSGRRRDGTEFPVEVSLAPLQDGEDQLVIASIRDVSDLERVQAANVELRRLLAVTDTALAHLELDDLLPALLGRVREVLGVDSATVLLVDAAGAELRVRAAHGLEEEVAAGVRVPVGQGFAGRIAASRAPLIVDDLSTFPVVSPFLRERLRSAVGIPLLLAGRVLGVLHVGMAAPRQFTDHDVALLQRVGERVAVAIERAGLFEAEHQARRAADAALLARAVSETRFRRLMEADAVGVVVGDAHRITEANDAFLRLVGHMRADLEAGRIAWTALTPPEHAAECAALDGRAVAEMKMRGACAPYEKEVVRSDGGRVPLLVSLVRLRSEPLEWACLALDRTEQRWLERERVEARAAELAARELARQLDQFFAMAAHDIRNPVAVAKGHVQLTVRRLEREEARRGHVAERTTPSLASARATATSLDQLARVTTQLFDVARARAGQLELELAPRDLAALVRDEVEARRVAAPGRTFVLEVPEQAVPVLADADRLRQVLGNYITNAIKYSADDTKTTVGLEVTEGLAVVWVRDEGPGLPWVERSRVWELYHRAAGVEVRGTAGGAAASLGLGLHICKRLIELHPGGRVGVESVEGEGSTFWFRLPLAN